MPTTLSDEPTTDRWQATDTRALIAFSLGLFMDAYIFGVASVATRWVQVPTGLRTLLLAWAPIWSLVGAACWGPLSDRIGRKATFYLTAIIAGLGAIGLALSHPYWLILTFLAVLLFAAAGDLVSIYAMVHEVMPTRHRSKSFFVVLNCGNLGGLVLGAVALSTAGHSVTVQRWMVVAVVGVVMVLWFGARRRTPESIRWLERTGRHEQARREIDRFYGVEQYQARRAEAEAPTPTLAESGGGRTTRPNLRLQLYVAVSMTFANIVGFGLVTYVMGPTFFPSRTPVIIFVTYLTAVTAGLLGLLGDRLSRRVMLLVGYCGCLVVAIGALLAQASLRQSLTVFVLFLVIYNVFVSVQYLNHDALRTEIWPTHRRATFTAIVGVMANGIGYIGSIFLVPHLGFQHTIQYTLGAWVIGLVAAMVWFVHGRETGAGTSLALASAEPVTSSVSLGLEAG